MKCDIERLQKEVTEAYFNPLPCLTQYSLTVIIPTKLHSFTSFMAGYMGPFLSLIPRNIIAPHPQNNKKNTSCDSSSGKAEMGPCRTGIVVCGDAKLVPCCRLEIFDG